MSLLSKDVRSRLAGIYTGPDRHYHDLRHIQGMLALAEEHGPAITDGEAVEAAIWFHDAVYDMVRIPGGCFFKSFAFFLGCPGYFSFMIEGKPAADLILNTIRWGKG